MTIYRVVATGISPGGDTFNFGLHLSKAGGSAADALTAWTTAIDNLWNGDGGTVVGVGGYYGTSTQIQSLVATALDPITGKNATQAQGSVSQAGFGSGQELPANTALCVSTRTGVPTRAGRGRYFLPGPLVSTLLNGLWENVVVLDFVTASQYMLNGLVASTYVPVIYHRATLSSTPITSTDVGDVPDVQNRRRNKIVEARQSLPVS